MATKILEVKLTQLQLAAAKTGKIMDKNNKEAIERHLMTLRSISNEIQTQKIVAEAAKINDKVELEEITEWSSAIDEKLEAADCEVEKINQWLQGKARDEENAAREERYGFEVKLNQLKIDSEQEAVKKNSKKVENSIPEVKRPKIEIAKFEGSPLDWPRFWCQFIETVDKQSISPVNKFAYLCGYLGTKVKPSVDGLPFTPEGYK